MLNPSRRYDVIIIGSGLEGLLCAALLAKRGKGVIVLEETPVAGGASFCLSKGEYTFTKGPSLFLGFERDGLYDRLFAEFGLSLSLLKREGILFQKTQPPLQIVLPDHRLDYFTNPVELQEEFRREFPDQIQEMKDFWMEMEQWEGIIRPRMHQARKEKPATLRDWVNEIRDWMRYHSAVRTQRKWRAGEFVQRFGLAPEIRRGLELLLLIFMGKNMEEATGLDLVHLLGLIQREMITINGGVPRLAELLVKVIRENQGEVYFSRPVTELILQRRTPVGVRTAEGEAVHGTSIILNLPWQSDSAGPSERKEFTLYFGVPENVIPSPMKAHLLMLQSYKDPSVADNFLYLRLNPARGPALAPKGQRALEVIGYIPESDLPRRDVLKSLIQSVTDHLIWLMPFSEGVLTYLGDDLGETGATARIPLKLAEQIQTSRCVFRDGACYYRSSLKNLYILPDLGRRPVATLESARSAFELTHQIIKNG